MSETRRPAARTHAHETLLCFPVEGLRADVARLPFRVVRASLDRGRDGLRALLIGVILLGAATTLYFLANGLVATLFPVLLLAGPPAIPRLADPTSRRLVVERGSALSAVREDHIFGAK